MNESDRKAIELRAFEAAKNARMADTLTTGRHNLAPEADVSTNLRPVRVDILDYTADTPQEMLRGIKGIPEFDPRVDMIVGLFPENGPGPLVPCRVRLSRPTGAGMGLIA